MFPLRAWGVNDRSLDFYLTGDIGFWGKWISMTC